MEWQIDKEHDGMVIRDYLQHVHGFSRRMIKIVKFDGGQICVNDVPKTVRYELISGDVLSIVFPPEIKGTYMEPRDVSIDIIYEDEHILIINKQAGIATMPSSIHPARTIANGVLNYYKERNIPYTVHVVTRLDRDTTGLILIAKHRYSHSLLAVSQRNGLVKRKYKAIMEGHLTEPIGTIKEPIGRKEGSIIERMVSEAGKTAITHYQVLAESEYHSLLEIQLETGRTHQIRVHFSHIGHPLAGDDLYGGSKADINRQALHCYELTFEHPLTNQMITVEAPLPEDMVSIFNRHSND
ncbi:RluA family pseudouridine synthase [Virgibacillus byunsanensis]|uniref:Pseudouridine synthase n=1 Tax=Virgibacillus byunsanensis TaxID=570945 RepID=A0ABW3LQL5_9BACI